MFKKLGVAIQKQLPSPPDFWIRFFRSFPKRPAFCPSFCRGGFPAPSSYSASPKAFHGQVQPSSTKCDQGEGGLEVPGRWKMAVLERYISYCPDPFFTEPWIMGGRVLPSRTIWDSSVSKKVLALGYRMSPISLTVFFCFPKPLGLRF